VFRGGQGFEEGTGLFTVQLILAAGLGLLAIFSAFGVPCVFSTFNVGLLRTGSSTGLPRDEMVQVHFQIAPPQFTYLLLQRITHS